MDGFKKESKDPNRDDIPSGLLRQRRNLFLISITLFFVYYSGVKIEAASLKIFGADLTLMNPAILNDFQIFWIVWAYFLVRYTQYIKFYGVLFDISTEYNDLLRPLYNKYFLSQLSAAFPNKFSYEPFVVPSFVRFNLRHGYRYVAPGNIEPNAENGLKKSQYSNEAFVENLGNGRGLYCSLVAFFRLISKSRHITDYWLPYLVAAAPVCLLFVKA